MNKKNSIYGVLIGLCFSSAYAVTEQINAAQTYLLKQESTVNINSEHNNNSNDDVIITNHVENNRIIDNVKAIAPNKELKVQQQNESLKILQNQLGLQSTGIMDIETMQYIQKFQEENSFNVTNILDYNTWFALFEQEMSWKIDTVKNAKKSWEDIVSKQTLANTSKFIVVNIPTMTLTGYEWDGFNAKEIVASKVVVGKPSTQTPLKNFDIISLKYNPTWTPTTGMLKRGAYKNGKLDLQWIKSHGLQILDSSNQIVSPDNMIAGQQYRFQQPAGDRNALGILKFETNSSDNIYLHDTNEKHYFNYNTRIYSSGCIRVQDFRNLANWLKNSNDVDEKLKRKDTYYEKLNKTPVYITYNQVIFYDNEPLFAPDVYKKNNNTQFIK